MSREERYLEWLERLEVPVDELTDIDTFQGWLADQLSPTEIDAETFEARTEALWNIAELKYGPLYEAGITPLLVEYPWGNELRFGWKGHPGLWGYESISEELE